MKPSSPLPGCRVSPLLLPVWLLGMLAVTLFPFEFRVAPEDARGALSAFGDGERFSVAEVVLNALLFVPLGALLHPYARRRFAGLGPMAIAGAAGLLLSLTVETLQLFLPRRDPSVSDLIANTAGALAGAWAHRTWGAGAEAWILRIRARGPRPILAGLLVAFTVVALGLSGALQLRTRLNGWSEQYPLLFGNEPTGDRPWRGRIFTFELTDAATPIGAVRAFAHGAGTQAPGTRIAAFDFSGGAPYLDSSGSLPPLEWSERRGTVSGEGGLRLPGRPWLQTGAPVPAVAQRIGRSNAFTVRVVCATDDLDQDGPARIVSNSLNTGWRNFTLGQRGPDAVFRFRTPLTGANGFRPEMVVPGAFSTLGRQEILVTYDGTTLLASVAGSARVHRADLTPGPSLALAITNLNVRASDLGVLNTVYLAALFFLPGILVGIFGRTRRGRLVLGLSWVVAFVALLEGTLMLVSGRRFDWGIVAANVLIGAVAVTIGATACRIGPAQDGRLVLTTGA